MKNKQDLIQQLLTIADLARQTTFATWNIKLENDINKWEDEILEALKPNQK